MICLNLINKNTQDLKIFDNFDNYDMNYFFDDINKYYNEIKFFISDY